MTGPAISSDSRHPIDRLVVVALAGMVAALILVAAFFSDNRATDIDEVGLYNPSYMAAHYGKLSYPVSGYWDRPVIVHPPIHVGSIGMLGRLGFTWYYAEATPVAVLLLLAIWSIAAGPFPAMTKVGLLCAAGFLVCLQDQMIFWFATRPEGHVHAAWFLALVLFESARLSGWCRWRLFAAAFLLAWASSVHYYATPALAGLAVYPLWAARDLGWKQAKSRVALIAGGALLFALPYLALYVIPNWKPIVEVIRSQQTSAGTVGLSFNTHLNMYRYWAGDNLVPALFRSACALGIPVVLWSTAILAAFAATRGMALAALPLQLGILFFASHKQGYYLVHEMAMFATAVAVGLGGLASLLTRIPKFGAWLRWIVVPGLAAALCLYAVSEPNHFRSVAYAPRSHVHEADLARAATRQILGPGARVAGRLGSWYQGGGDSWHDPSFDLLAKDATYSDAISYLESFDAVADYPHRSGDDSSFKEGLSLSRWYATGTLKLRGFYFSYIGSDLDTILTTVHRPARVVGYVNRGGVLFRFDDSPEGDHAVISASCPNLPQFSYWNFRAAYPWASRSILQLPKTPGGPEVIATVLTPIANAEPAKLLAAACAEIGRVRGVITPVDLDRFVAEFRSSDRPIRFYRDFSDISRASANPSPLASPIPNH